MFSRVSCYTTLTNRAIGNKDAEKKGEENRRLGRRRKAVQKGEEGKAGGWEYL
jgi:hypothetical protein